MRPVKVSSAARWRPTRRGSYPGTAVARNDANIDESFAEFGSGRTKSYVAKQCQVAAGADGRALDRGDGGNVEAVKGLGDALDALDIAAPCARGAAAENSLAVAHVLDVATGGKRRALGRQQENPRVVTDLGTRQGIQQFVGEVWSE